MPLAFFHHPDQAAHRMTPGHPECPERMDAIMEHLKEEGLLDEFDRHGSDPVGREALARVHEGAYLDQVEKAAPDDGLVSLDPDTWMAPGSLRAAQLASGAVVGAVELVLEGKTKRAFCANRPPGHHAESGEAMGFCLFNHVAVGAAAALEHEEVNRVAVLDFDVHHGNGSVEMFQDRPEVLVCSSYQHPFYPNRFHDVERDHLVHTRLPAGTGSKDFRTAIEKDWPKAIEEHKPDLILVSAGFDAHRDDPLAQLELGHEDFAWITKLIVALAEKHCEGRVVSTLEGGYNLTALPRSVAAHLEALEASG